MSGFFGKAVRYGAVVLWIVAGGWMSALTASELRTLWMVVPTPPEVVQDFTIRNVEDDSGRKSTFRILLFSDEFRWRINSFDAVEHGSTQPEFTQEMKAVLNSAREIICVGASSEEIPSGASFPQGRAQEERRAALRAEKIALWVRKALSRPIPVRKLNVGHHAPTGTDQTLRSAPRRDHSGARQRRGRRHRSIFARGDGRRERARADLRSAVDQVFPGFSAILHMGPVT